MVTAKTPPPGQDILAASANNLYVGVTMKDLANFKEKYPLNSRLVKTERPPRGRGLQDRRPLRQARSPRSSVTSKRRGPSPRREMATALAALVDSGTAPAKRPIARRTTSPGCKDKASPVDTINGFTEVYMDARGVKGSWEALVFYVNQEKTTGIKKLAESAQWFEDRMPWDAKYRKASVQGITANAIDVVIETGDSGPVTPVGINLPNDQNVREQHGSKSVSLSNVSEAYDKSTPIDASAASSRGRRKKPRARRSGAHWPAT